MRRPPKVLVIRSFIQQLNFNNSKNPQVLARIWHNSHPRKVSTLIWFTLNVATPLWLSVGVKPNTSKVGDLESSETPECLGFDSKAQNTSH